MEFDWSESKRFFNLEKHGIDFHDAKTMWRGPVIDPAAERFVDGEYRPLALGTIGEDAIVIAVIYSGTE